MACHCLQGCLKVKTGLHWSKQCKPLFTLSNGVKHMVYYDNYSIVNLQ